MSVRRKLLTATPAAAGRPPLQDPACRFVAPASYVGRPTPTALPPCLPAMLRIAMQAGGVRSAHLNASLWERGRRHRQCCFPPPWFPPWNPPSEASPLQTRNPPGGEPILGGHSTAAFPARPDGREPFSGLRPGLPAWPRAAALRVAGCHSAALPIPPTPQGRPHAGRPSGSLLRAAVLLWGARSGSARLALSHGLRSPWCSLRSRSFTHPPWATAPQGAGPVAFAAARGSRAGERLQRKERGFPPYPLQRARSCRRIP